MLCPSCDTERRRLFDETVRQKPNKGASCTGSVPKTADGTQLYSSSATATKTTSSLSERPASTSSDTSTTVQADNVFDAATTYSNKVIVNELLTYVQFYRDRSTVESA